MLGKEVWIRTVLIKVVNKSKNKVMISKLVKDLEIYLDNKIKQVMGRTQEEGKKKVIIYCLENMKQELKNEGAID